MADDWMTKGGTLAVGSLATASLGVIFREWFLGVITTVQTFASGVSFALGGLGSFLEDGLIPGLVGLAVDGSRAAWETNAAWLADTFGVWAFPAAVLEVALIVWLIAESAGFAMTRVRGGLG